MRIIKENCLGLIIDVQERLFPHIYNGNELIKNITTLIQGLKILEVPISVTEQYKKGLGVTIPEISILINEFNPSEKTAFSCCDDKVFMNSLNNGKTDTIILAGIEAHICVMQTAVDLMQNNFRPVVVEDCVASRNPENKRIAINRILQLGITVTSYESLLFELCRYAGNDTFKAISKIVK